MEKEIRLTAVAVKGIKELLADIQKASRGDLRIFNLCRRIEATLIRAERRKLRVRHQTNSLLMQEEIINEILTQQK